MVVTLQETKSARRNGIVGYLASELRTLRTQAEGGIVPSDSDRTHLLDIAYQEGIRPYTMSLLDGYTSRAKWSNPR